MIRVLHIVTYMGRGGLETMIMNYYRNIDRSKVQFDFLVHRDFVADYDEEILSLGGKIHRISPLNPFSKSYLNQLDNFFKTHTEYKIVHCHLDCMAGIPLKYAKKHGVPIRIAHAHSSSQTKDAKYLLKLFFKRNITKNANQLFACSQKAGEWTFCGKKNFNVLNNAIDAKKYRFDKETSLKIRKEFGIDEKTKVIGHVGRFEVPKNHEFIIKVFAEYLINQPDSILMLVGIGSLENKIRDMVNTLNIKEKVVFTGLRSDVPELLQAMDLFLFPSLYEGLPVSIIEAQSAGLPCLISNKVPIEVKKTECVYQMNLSDDAGLWAERLFELGQLERKDTYADIKLVGFDIINNAEKLVNYYIVSEKGEKYKW